MFRKWMKMVSGRPEKVHAMPDISSNMTSSENPSKKNDIYLAPTQTPRQCLTKRCRLAFKGQASPQEVELRMLLGSSIEGLRRTYMKKNIYI